MAPARTAPMRRSDSRDLLRLLLRRPYESPSIEPDIGEAASFRSLVVQRTEAGGLDHETKGNDHDSSPRRTPDIPRGASGGTSQNHSDLVTRISQLGVRQIDRVEMEVALVGMVGTGHHGRVAVDQRGLK